jgi:vancomycin permeability regulator SanA
MSELENTRFCDQCDAVVGTNISGWESDTHNNFHERIDEMQGTIDALVDLITKNAPRWLEEESK